MDADKQVPCIRFDNRGRIRPNGWLVRWALPGEPVALMQQNDYYFEWWTRVLDALEILPIDGGGMASIYSLTSASLGW